MSRLVDYFVVVGYDHEKERAGKVLQRFPSREWPDTPFPQGIEMFCQPQGWKTYESPKVPEFFISVLTDIDACRHYCSCLSFVEAFVPTGSSSTEEDDEDTDLPPSRVLYAPKSICLISRHDYCDTFRQCLGIIYAIYVDQLQYRLENVIGNLLGFIQVPPPGGPQQKFSIGAEDRQAVQPPQSASLPVSRDSVVTFCQEIGLSNVMLLLCATLADSKILFFSSSYLRLLNASHALTTICYPLKYSHVYVPILPAPLLEVLNSPTPYIMGIHISLREQVLDLLDVIFVDLDGCRVEVPESVSIALAPDPIYSRTMASLKMVLDPSLLTCDQAFPPAENQSPRTRNLPASNGLLMTDKELRAVFVQFFCELFAGYRSCLTVVRIHPEAVITFQKAKFLGQRNFVGDEFVTKVVESMAFGKFIQEYASPYRVQNAFDEFYANYEGVPILPSTEDVDGFSLTRLKVMANQLYCNENPQSQPYAQKCLRPSERALTRIAADHGFPLLDARLVEEIIQEGQGKHAQLNKWPNCRSPASVIPLGYTVSAVAPTVAVNSARRLEVLSNCIGHIFECRYNDANKLMPAVIRVLAIPSARLALATELKTRVQSNRAMLEHQQFELVVKLINCALQDDSVMDEYGVAAAFLPLVTAFCRKLCTGVIQFAYTRVQEHEIWRSMAFWESAFYKDVQQHITDLYWPSLFSSSPLRRPSQNGVKENGLYEERRQSEDDLKAFAASLVSPTALDIAATQLRSDHSDLPVSDRQEIIEREESTVFSQAIHYANRIVYLRVPLDVSSARGLHRRNSMGTDTNSNSNFTASHQESDQGSVSEESGFQEADEKASRDVTSGVVKFVSKFVDKVCGESHVTQDHIKQLHHMVPGVVAMHVEGLEAVYKESKHLQPIQKTRILKPTLLPGEDTYFSDGLRGHLLVDGREESTGGVHGGPSLLPCEGALFLTSYRVIFMGTPVESYVSDYVVVRSFPVASLTKEKKLSGQYINQLNLYSAECIQLRSAAFQLIKVGFDEEVTVDLIDQFRKFLEQMRYPASISEILNHGPASQSTTLAPGKNGKKGIRGFAKKTLQRTVRAAGMKTKTSSKKENKGYNPSQTPMPDRRIQLTLANDKSKTVYEEDGSDDDGETLGPNGRESLGFERVIERGYIRDYRRMGLIVSTSAVHRRSDEYRLTAVNLHYKVCTSYPALVVVPNHVTDDSVKSLARHFKENRFPAVVWQHPRSKAVLIRSGSYITARMSSVFKNSSMSTAGSMMTIPTASNSHEVSISASSQADLEKYLSAVVHSMPNSVTRRPSVNGSILTVNNLSFNSTPEAVRRYSNATPWNRAVQTLRTGSGKSTVSKRASAMFPSSKGGSLLHPSASDMYPGADSLSDADRSSLTQTSASTNLYVLAEKNSIKALRSESLRCDFIPLEYPDIRRVKAGHKKLLQVMVPSMKEAEGILEKQGGYLGQVENLDWLKQIQRLLKIAGSLVDIMDSQGSSIMLALEEGWDATCQVSALAQLFMDPYYRTVYGFGDLVEKEFSAFGHRFGHRNNLTQASQTSGIAPVFLQFLDCVAQVHRQFPLSFEFNEYFLKFIAFHSASNRFTNFLTDCEAERVDLGLLENRKVASSPTYEPDLTQWPVTTGSIWEYISVVHKKTQKFFNFMYSRPLLEDQALRPFTNTHNIFLWDFYADEALAFGSLYDLELIDPDCGPESTDQIPKGGNKRRIVNAGYNSPSQTILNSFTELFEEIRQLETEMGRGVEDWQDHWNHMDQLIAPPAATASAQMIRSHSRRLQTQITMEILDKGRHNDSPQALGHPHRFTRETYSTPTHCNSCNAVLWGNAVLCADCGFRAHEKCSEQVGNTCSKIKVTTTQQNVEAAMSRHILVGRDHLRDSSPSSPRRGQFTDTGPSLSDSRALLEGYLNKRGAMLKQWKAKWFVLDSIKHQLRYYDHRDDPHVSGVIDLADVVACSPTGPGIILQSAPKNTDDRACFDVRTLKRTYNLCAKDPAAAQEWMEKIQLYLQ